MSSHLSSICLLIITISISLSITPAVSTYKALVTPITKDDSTSLFSITFNTTKDSTRSFVVDIVTHLSWQNCQPKHSYRNVPSKSSQCCDAKKYDNSLCHHGCTSPDPNLCDADISKNCRCRVVAVNPVSNRCDASCLTTTEFEISTTDGHNPLADATVGPVYTGCAPKPLFESLPSGADGLVSFSRAPLAIPSQLTESTGLKKQFGICLPSGESAPGVAFMGTGPFFVLPPPGRNLNDLLQFTPLIQKPGGTSFGYFIGVKGITINQTSVKFPTQMLEFDSYGNGGVSISTVVPYTTMRTKLYRAFLDQYKKATSGLQRVSGPFELCLNSTDLGSTRVGPPVPQIDLQLTNGRNWTIFGANSFKQVSENVTCLAFVDGGEKAEQAMVIGSYQIEHNFLLFDLEKNQLGFSSILFFFQTTCSNFNFTSGV